MAIQLAVWLDSEPGLAAVWLAVLLTYWVHAAVWAGAAALLARRRRLRSAARHAVFTLALFGPLATTLLAVAVSSGAGEALGAAPYVHDISVETAATDPAPDGSVPTIHEPSVKARWWGRLAALAITLPALGVLRFGVSVWRFRRRLIDRKRVADPRLLRRLAIVALRFRRHTVVLSQSASLETPAVIGRSEICIPAAKLAALDDPEVDAVLAHELAHLERGDGLWFPLVGLVEAALWIQPMTSWAAASYRATAELVCDDRAVELTGEPLHLARALTEVAAGARLPRAHAMVPTMARSPSTLVWRVRRLAAGDPAELRPTSRGRRWAILALSVVGLATVGVNVHVARARPAEAARRSAPFETPSPSVEGPPELGPESIHVPPPPEECTRAESDDELRSDLSY